MPTSSEASAHTTLWERAVGKWTALQTLVMFQRYLANWREVWEAYRRFQSVPPLRLRGGLTVTYGDGDDPIALLGEIFGARIYDCDGFYTPRAGDIVIDVGANIGMFAVYLQWNARGVNVHCFEPSVSSFGRLKANIELNKIGSVVRAYNVAVSAQEGTANLSAGQSLVRSIVGNDAAADNGSARAAGETVRTIDLNAAIDMAGAARIDLLKIDVEGAEVEILNGAAAASWQKIERVVVEIHDNIRPGTHRAVTTAIAKAGLRVVREIDLPNGAGPTILHARR